MQKTVDFFKVYVIIDIVVLLIALLMQCSYIGGVL